MVRFQVNSMLPLACSASSQRERGDKGSVVAGPSLSSGEEVLMRGCWQDCPGRLPCLL